MGHENHPCLSSNLEPKYADGLSQENKKSADNLGIEDFPRLRQNHKPSSNASRRGRATSHATSANHTRSCQRSDHVT